LHNQVASVAALRELFAFGPECRSRSLRNQRSPSSESSVTDKIVVKPASIENAVKAHIEATLRRRFGEHLDHVKIETRGDHVILRGMVASLSERIEVERAAWTTPGVCHVDNNLAVERLTKSP
jgi:osmotically-inducible protein OsmY